MSDVARGGQNSVVKQSASRRGSMRSAEVSPERRERLDQARVLRDPRVRALWPRLKRRQQQVVLDPKRSGRSPLPAEQRRDRAADGDV